MKRTASILVFMGGILYTIIAVGMVVLTFFKFDTNEIEPLGYITLPLLLLSGFVKGIIAFLNWRKIEKNPKLSVGIMFILLGVFSITPMVPLLFIVGGILTIILSRENTDKDQVQPAVE